MKHHAFLACHPAVNLLYFVLVLTFSMFFLHPWSRRDGRCKICRAVSLGKVAPRIAVAVWLDEIDAR